VIAIDPITAGAIQVAIEAHLVGNYLDQAIAYSMISDTRIEVPLEMNGRERESVADVYTRIAEVADRLVPRHRHGNHHALGLLGRVLRARCTMHCRSVPATIEIEPAESWEGDDITSAHEVTGEQAAELFRQARAAEEAAVRIERDVAWWLEERGYPLLALDLLSGAWRAA